MVDGGQLVGSDMGEFGGSIWWRRPDGHHDTLRVQGRDTSGFHADNLHRFILHRGAVYALVGLAHLTLNEGELLLLSRDGTRWSARQLLSLGGAPRAVTRLGNDTILILTTDSLLSVGLDPARPTRRALHGNGTWSYTYPSSMIQDRAGLIYIGMRGAVVRLTPAERGYKEDWLVPAQCRRRVPVGDWGPCRCEADTR